MAERFQTAYLEGTPPWDIGRPQAEFVRLAEAGRIDGRVIDIGCGTGENALFIASRGLDVVGVDAAPEAIRQATEKAAARGVPVRFEVADVLDLNQYTAAFDTAIDSGVFHVFDDDSRPLYARSVGGALRPGARLFLMCFSEHEPGDWGPRRVTRAEIRSTFADGWIVDAIEPATFETNLEGEARVQAWLARLTRSAP
ncbi:MAG TPA: class I SAM-dependent methyltransferase [Candidatus Acidoferrales bacterium]|nr:class I SAM-dependent methyltransferase [Candidatus Acidoferrales bacterium]